MKLSWLLLFLFLLPAHAEIYRWVDANGNVVYSDEPHPDAETVDLPASTSYTPDEESEPDILKLSPVDEDVNEPNLAEAANYQLRIIAPADDESIWVNNGNVSVSMLVEPSLNTERGDQIILHMNGTQVGSAQTSTTFQLNNINRGTHTLSAEVVDNTGATLTNSASVTFHLHRTSIINNNTNSTP